MIAIGHPLSALRHGLLSLAVLTLLATVAWPRPGAAATPTDPDVRMVPQAGLRSPPTGFVASPDGQSVAVYGYDDDLYLRSVEEDLLIHVLGGATGDIQAVAFSPDGSLVAAGTELGTVHVWAVVSGALLQSVDTLGWISERRRPRWWDASQHSRLPVWSLAFSPDGLRLAVGQDGGAGVWNRETARLDRAVLPAACECLDDDTCYDCKLSDLAFSSDGRWLAMTDDYGLNVVDTTTWQDRELHRFEDRHGDESPAVDFLDATTLLARAPGSDELATWDTDTGRRTGTHALPEATRVDSLALDGARQRVAGWTGTELYVVDLKSGEATHRVAAEHWVPRADFAGSHSLLFEAPDAYDVEPTPSIARLDLDTGDISYLSTGVSIYDEWFDDIGSRLDFVDGGGVLMSGWTAFHWLDPDSAGFTSFDSSEGYDSYFVCPDGRMLIAESMADEPNGKRRLGIRQRGLHGEWSTVGTITHSESLRSFAFAPDCSHGVFQERGADELWIADLSDMGLSKIALPGSGREAHLGSSAIDQKARSWKIATASHILVQHAAWTEELSKKEEIAVPVSARIIDIESLRTVRGYTYVGTIESGGFTGLGSGPFESLWISGDLRRGLRGGHVLVDLVSGRDLRDLAPDLVENGIEFDTNLGPVAGATLDDRLLAVSYHGEVALFSLADGALLGTLRGGENGTDDLAIDAGGERLAILGMGGVLSLWHLESGEQLLRMDFFERGEDLGWLSYTPDGYYDHSEGAENLVAFFRGTERIEDDATLRQQFRRPDVLAQRIRGQVCEPPAYLTLDGSFLEPSGDGVLEVSEAGHLELTVENGGRGTARSVAVRSRLGEDGIRFELGSVPTIDQVQPGTSETLRIPLTVRDVHHPGSGRLLLSAVDSCQCPGQDVALTVPVMPLREPDLVAELVRVDDDLDIPSQGNGNGVIEAREIVQLEVQLRNTGPGEARDVSVRLESEAPGLSIVSSPTVFPTVPAGASVSMEFVARAGSDLTGGTDLGLTVRIDEQRPEFARHTALSLSAGAPFVPEVTTLVCAPDPDVVPRPSDWAIVVGAQGYDGAIGEPPATDRDVSVITDCLVHRLGVPRDQVIRVTGPRAATRSAIDGALLELEARRLDPENSRVFFYYSGHGTVLDEGEGRGERSFLVPVDANRTVIDGVGLDPGRKAEVWERSLLSREQLLAGLDRLDANLKLVMLDACYMAPLGRPLVPRHAVENPSRRVVWLVASDPQRTAKVDPETGLGVFTGSVVRTLNATGDAGGASLGEFVSRLMGEYGQPIPDPSTWGQVYGPELTPDAVEGIRIVP